MAFGGRPEEGAQGGRRLGLKAVLLVEVGWILNLSI